MYDLSTLTFGDYILCAEALKTGTLTDAVLDVVSTYVKHDIVSTPAKSGLDEIRTFFADFSVLVAIADADVSDEIPIVLSPAFLRRCEKAGNEPLQVLQRLMELYASSPTAEELGQAAADG